MNMTGAIIKNNIDSGFYLIGAETDNSYELFAVRPVTDPVTGEVTYEDCNVPPVTLTKGVFDTVCDIVVEAPPVELTMADVIVTNGKMAVCGEDVECGTLHINKAVAVVPGGVIVEVRSKDGKGVDLKFYDVETDHFSRMTSDKDTAELIYQDGSLTAFVVEKKTEVKIPTDCEDDEGDDDDDNGDCTTETAIDRSVRFYARGVGVKMIPNVLGDEIDRRKDGDSDVILFATDKGYKSVCDTYGYPVVIADSTLDGTDTRTNKVVISHDENGNPWAEDSVNRLFHGRVVDFMYGADGYVFVIDAGKGADRIGHENAKYGKKENSYRMAVGDNVVAAVRKYPVPVSIDVPEPAKTVFVFAAEDMSGVCRIEVEKTRDRGYVTKIEEI